MQETSVLIIGARYASLMAAMRLAGRTRRQPVNITLINPDEQFVERPLLHEVATGVQPKILPIAQMLRGTGVNLRIGRVTAIEPENNTVVVDGCERLDYDYLFYALGSRTDRESVPGVNEYAYTLDPSGPRSTADLFDRLEDDATKQVVVAGSGPTGIEVAAEIAERYPRIRVRVITSGKFATFADDAVHVHMRRALDRLGVEVVEDAPIVRVGTDRLLLQDGDSIPADLCVWAGGFRALPLARESGLRTNSRGQVLVDPAMRALSHPNVFAVGDSTAPVQSTGAPPRMRLIRPGYGRARCRIAEPRAARQGPKAVGFLHLWPGHCVG